MENSTKNLSQAPHTPFKRKARVRIDELAAKGMIFSEKGYFAETGASPSPQSVTEKFWTECDEPPDTSMNESMVRRTTKLERRTRAQRNEAKLKVSPIKPQRIDTSQRISPDTS